MSSIFKIFFLLALITVCSCYDHNKARRFGAYSYVTQCNPARLVDWDVGSTAIDYPGVTDVMVVQSPLADVLAFIAYLPADKTILVSFRGTSNNLNWISNIKIGWLDFVPACNCRVHNGFYGDYKLIQEKIVAQLIQYRQDYQGSKIYVIGHSLGGSLATLFTADLHDRGVKVDYLQTIGSPRVGDSNFANWFNSEVTTTTEYYRISHAHDPVVHLPQSFFGYTHVDSEVYYADTDYVECRSGEDPNCSAKASYSPFTTGDHGTYLGLDGALIKSTCQ